MGMKILITGGAGCLGTNLIEHWLPLGHEVFVIDNYATGKKAALPEVEGLTVVEGDIQDKALVDECFEKFQPTHVIHSAASYKDPDDWEEDIRTNALGTLNIVNASKKHNIKRLINFQTALCYGRPKVIPIPVDHAKNPFTSYGVSKTAGESIIMSSGLSAVSLRLANICGPRLAIGPIPTFYQRLQADKACFCSDTIRDFLDMSDFIALMDIVIDEDAPCGVFNVSTGVGNTIKDIFDEVIEHLGMSKDIDVPIVPVGDDDIQAVVLDPSKTEEVFGWKAKNSFKETIKKQLQWYDKHGVTDIYSHLSEPKS